MLKRSLRRAGLTKNRAFDKPELQYGLQFFLQVFLSLTNDRNYEGGPIPTGAIIGYSDFYRMNFQETWDLIYFIQALDRVFLDYSEKKRKK